MLAAERSPTPLNALPPDRLIKWREVVALMGFSKTSLYAKIRAGEFPEPVRLGSAGSVRWSFLEVQRVISEAIAARERNRSAPRPD
jgi:prophage regulatory protein